MMILEILLFKINSKKIKQGFCAQEIIVVDSPSNQK